MGLFAQLMTAVSSFVAALSVFGGDAYDKESTAPFLKRITARGWVSFSGLIGVLVFSVWAHVEADQTQKRLENELSSQTETLTRLKTTSENQKKTIEKLQSEIESQSGTVRDSNQRIAKLQTQAEDRKKTIDAQEKSIAALRKKAENADREVMKIHRQRDRVLKEFRNLKSIARGIKFNNLVQKLQEFQAKLKQIEMIFSGKKP